MNFLKDFVLFLLGFEVVDFVGFDAFSEVYNVFGDVLELVRNELFAVVRL